jgi:hypothetical protein
MSVNTGYTMGKKDTLAYETLLSRQAVGGNKGDAAAGIPRAGQKNDKQSDKHKITPMMKFSYRQAATQRRKTKKITEAEFEEAIVAAFFNLKGCYVTPYRKLDGTIAFSVQGNEIQSALQAMHENKTVGALDFIKSLKAVKVSIFSLNALRSRPE